MRRIVLDTNIIISGLAWKGKPSKIIDLWKEGKLELCLSGEVLDEYLELLNRKLESSYYKWFVRLIEEAKYVKIVKPGEHFHIIEEDPDDDKFIDCAVESQADFIISGDEHLKKLEEFQGIPILSPDDFLKKIEQKEITFVVKNGDSGGKDF
ncbi:MAG: putative toxin-antitoxin system toxin component, PIN family [Armatimonadetes bacterium CG07_land_8_20_14_0_80_40_9]|nr:MAG: putative toxin-antitoxin system toxin component, PIN family [Armatimonadetes bacterium CG07_land_8_20_14_0_80_40_9]